jgi:hypothetical protein
MIRSSLYRIGLSCFQDCVDVGVTDNNGVNSPEMESRSANVSRPNPEPAASTPTIIPSAPPIDSLLNGTWNARRASAEVGRETARDRLALVNKEKCAENSNGQPPHSSSSARDSLLAELRVRLSTN